MSQHGSAGCSWPEAPVLTPWRGTAVDPLDVLCPESSDGSSPGGVVESDSISRLEASLAVGSVPGNVSCSSYHPVDTVRGASVICACSDRLVNEIPSFDPFSLASSFRSRKRSGVPPASCAAGVAQLDGVLGVGGIPINCTVSIKFDRLPSMCSIPRPSSRTTHSASDTPPVPSEAPLR